MKPVLTLLLAAAFAVSFRIDDAQAADAAYIEFLWSSTPERALARAEALGFLVAGRPDHRVCVVVPERAPGTGTLRIDVLDASGALVSRRTHADFSGPKRCYAAGLPASGVAGEWTFKVYLGRALAAVRTIEVARSLQDAGFYAHPSRPFVLGRPNYDPAIPAIEYIGRLVWVMEVDETGKVAHVEVERAEGAGKLMKDRAVAAGRLTRFPPDPSRSAEPLKVRQEYVLGTD